MAKTDERPGNGTKVTTIKVSLEVRDHIRGKAAWGEPVDLTLRRLLRMDGRRRRG